MCEEEERHTEPGCCAERRYYTGLMWYALSRCCVQPRCCAEQEWYAELSCCAEPEVLSTGSGQCAEPWLYAD